MGTTIGAVVIIDSESITLLKYLNWHEDKVRALLVMPEQVGPCICAEIPFPKSDSCITSKSSSDKSLVPKKKTLVPKKEGIPNVHENLSAPQQCSEVKFSPVLVASIGNGKKLYNSQNSEKDAEVGNNIIQLTWSV